MKPRFEGEMEKVEELLTRENGVHRRIMTKKEFCVSFFLGGGEAGSDL